MSTPNEDDQATEPALNPKERMKAALDAKKAAQHASAAAGPHGAGKASGGPHGPQGGKRTFRRKAGG